MGALTASPVEDTRAALLKAMADNRPRRVLEVVGADLAACRLHLPHAWRPCGEEWHPRMGWYVRRAWWCTRCRVAFEVDDMAALNTWTVPEEATRA